MNEGFCITAPGAKRSLVWTDGLRSIFFGNKARELVPLLIVPARLKKQPQKESQKQSQKRAVASAAASAATTNLQRGSLDSRPSPGAATALQNSTNATAATGSSGVTFSALPLEICSLIFDHLDDIVDLTCVGLATPYLWGIVQRIIHQRYKAMVGKWAGEQIVCVGEEIPPGDYPPGLFSVEEIERLNKEVYVSGYDQNRTWPRTLSNLTNPPNGTLDEIGVTANAEAGRVYYECLRRFTRYPSFKLREKLLWIYTDRPDFTTSQEDWILRNLTTKEFVTAEGIALDKDFIDGPFIFGIGFGEAVVARTLWTSNGTPDLRYGGQIGRGIWAGHRFDIITRSQHDEATKGEEWKDVSAEVAGEIAGIWESQFGPNWIDVRNFHRRFEEGDEDERERERDVAHDLDVAMDEYYNVHVHCGYY